MNATKAEAAVRQANSLAVTVRQSVQLQSNTSKTTLLLVQTKRVASVENLAVALMEGYDDEYFEEDEGHALSSADKGSWKEISFEEVELGEQLGGGSVGLVHRGAYAGKAVALKTLVGVRYTV